jgi:CheY-like chemotaxis protein
MNASPTKEPGRILVVGRSPSVLVDTVEILRSKGYSADATNQFDRVLDDYDAQAIDVVVFGGMVPADTKQHLRQEIGERNAHVTFVQGLAGIAGLIAAQVEGVITAGEPDDSHVVYDQEQRSMYLTLHKAARVTVEAWWHTSFTPPEPTSTSMQVLNAELEEGSYSVALSAEVPSVASFLAVTVGSAVRTFTVGAMPQSVMSMVPTGGSSATGSPSATSQLPPVSEVNTRSHDR